MFTYTTTRSIIFFYIKLLCIHEAMSVTLWLYYSDVHFSVYIPLHISSELAQWRARETWNPKDLRLLVRAHGATLFFFQQCLPVGITIFTGEDSQSE